MSKDVKKKKSEETVQDEVKNQETDAKKEEACNCESECKADESQNTCEADESDKAEAQDESTESSKKKDPKDAVIEELQDRVKRQMAEFDNFRKRSEKEKSQMFDMGAKTIVEKILPVIDNFERGLAAVPDDKKDDPFITGMDKVYKQMLTELDAAGVKPIECVGQEFDPDFHNAVMQVENDELESGTVAQELQKGYMYKDSVVRHSMVSVVQ